MFKSRLHILCYPRFLYYLRNCVLFAFLNVGLFKIYRRKIVILTSSRTERGKCIRTVFRIKDSSLAGKSKVFSVLRLNHSTLNKTLQISTVVLKLFHTNLCFTICTDNVILKWNISAIHNCKINIRFSFIWNR